MSIPSRIPDSPGFTWVSPYDPDDARGGWKSMQFHLLRALEARLGRSTRINSVEVPEEFLPTWISRVQRKLGIPRGYAYFSDNRLNAFAEKVASRLPQNSKAPIVFFGALPFVNCRPTQPYYIYTDGAFFIHYWEYNQDHSHAPTEIQRICAAEARFMKNAAEVWCSSQWVASRIAKEYQIPSGKVRFVGTGPGDVPKPHEKVTYGNSLAMIAADFERKQGRLAVDAVAAARNQQLDLTLKFIGAKPPPDVLALPFVEWCGWLDMGKEADRNRFSSVLEKAGAHVLLSRADLTPLAIPEAAVYSKATIGAAVGGVPEMIQDGLTGWLVEGASPAQIAPLLIQIFSTPGVLERAGTAANSLHRIIWNWEAVAAAAVRHWSDKRSV